MPEVKLSITIPEEKWVSEVSQTYPDATFRILAAIPQNNHGVGLAEIRHESPSTILEEIPTYEDIEDVTVLTESDDTALVQFETALPLLLLAASESGVPLSMPFTISQGVATWELTAPNERVSALGTHLDAAGIQYSIEYIQSTIDQESLLSESQERVVQTAIKRGYYESPRECSLADIADELDRATSTVGETLQRAERKIIKRYAGSSDTGL